MSKLHTGDWYQHPEYGIRVLMKSRNSKLIKLRRPGKKYWSTILGVGQFKEEWVKMSPEEMMLWRMAND